MSVKRAFYYGLFFGLFSVLFVGALLSPSRARASNETSGRTIVYQLPHSGYTLSYPVSWSVREVEPFTVLFEPAEEGGTSGVSVVIHNEKAPSEKAPSMGGATGGDSGGAAQGVASLYLQQMRSQANASSILREASFRWDIGRGVISGRQVVSQFKDNGVLMQQWAVFLPSPYAPVVHVWMYTAPVSAFSPNLPAAQGILSSLQPKHDS